jgi:hypothetical protein
MELTFEDLQLMAEDQNLDVFVPIASPCHHHKVEDPAQSEAEKGEDHRE